MKKLILLVVLVFIAALFLNAETKLKMELWNRWTYEKVGDDLTSNELALKRGYFRLEPKFGNNIKGRFNLDFFSDDVGDGVGIKMKYAYLDFSNFLPVKDMKLTVGLMKTYFGTIYDWSYQVIDKDPSDKYGFVSSTDYGLGVSGYIPNGFGTYALAVYNGEGYKKTGGDINLDMNFAGNIRITPVSGVTVGGSYMMKTDKAKEIDDGTRGMIPNPAREEYAMMAGVSKLAFGPFSLLGQYLMKTTSMPNIDGMDDVKGNVLSAMPVFRINDKIELIARYDICEPDADTENDKETTIIGGFNYYIQRDSKNAPKLFVQVNYEQMTPEDSNADKETQILAQLRWIFSETLNKGK